MEWQFILMTSAIGFFAGVFGGMLGIGGSIIMIPLLTLVHGPNQQLYQAAAMIVNVPVAASATIKHAIKRVIKASVVRALLPTALVGIVLGVTLSNLISTDWLQIVFAVFLGYIGISELFRLVSNHEHIKDVPTSPETTPPRLRIPLIGGFNGIIAGLLGIGGGVILIPLLRRFCKLDMKTAIAASSMTMLITATVGATYKNLALPELSAPDGTPLEIGQSLLIAGAMFPTAFIGSYIGAGLTHRLPIQSIKLVFAILVLFAAIRMGWMTTQESLAPSPEMPGVKQIEPKDNVDLKAAGPVLP